MKMLNELKREILEKVKEWNADFIFVTTEEEIVIEIFKKEFKEKLIFVERERYKNYSGNKKIPEIEVSTRKIIDI